MGKRLEQELHKQGFGDGLSTYGKILNIIPHQGNVDSIQS